MSTKQGQVSYVKLMRFIELFKAAMIAAGRKLQVVLVCPIG